MVAVRPESIMEILLKMELSPVFPVLNMEVQNEKTVPL
jgi:hypothetical protein